MTSTVFKSIKGSKIILTNNVSQIVLGSTNTTTISATAPSASRTYTIPDTGANSNFIMSDLAQTINGVKTFTSGTIFNATSNQIILGVTNTTTISATAPSASRVYTLPDTAIDASFVMTESAQTINGLKTFGNGTTNFRAPAASNAVLQLNGNNTNPSTTGYQIYVPSANNKITIASRTTGTDIIDFAETGINFKEPIDVSNGNANFRTWLQNTSVATGAGSTNIARITFTANITMLAEFKVYSIDSGGGSSTFISTYEIKNTAGTVTSTLLFTNVDVDQTVSTATATNIFYLAITQSGTLTKNVVTYINVLNVSSGSFSIPDVVT